MEGTGKIKGARVVRWAWRWCAGPIRHAIGTFYAECKLALMLT